MAQHHLRKKLHVARVAFHRVRVSPEPDVQEQSLDSHMARAMPQTGRELWWSREQLEDPLGRLMGTSCPGFEKAHFRISDGEGRHTGVQKMKCSPDCNSFSLKCAVFSDSESKHFSSKRKEIELYSQRGKIHVLLGCNIYLLGENISLWCQAVVRASRE